MSDGANKDLPQEDQNNEEFKAIQDEEDHEIESTVVSFQDSSDSNIDGEVTRIFRVPLDESPPLKWRATGETSVPLGRAGGGRGRGRGGEGEGGSGDGEGGDDEGEGGGRYRALKIRASNHPDVIKENKAAAAQAKSKRNPKEK